MDPKAWLSQMYDLERYIQWLKGEKSRVDELRCSLPSLAPKDVRSQGSSSGNARYVDIIARTEREMDGILARLATAIEEQENLRDDIRKAAEALPDPNERQVILYKYCDLITLGQAACKMHYSYRHVKRFHTRALKHIRIP